MTDQTLDPTQPSRFASVYGLTGGERTEAFPDGSAQRPTVKVRFKDSEKMQRIGLPFVTLNKEDFRAELHELVEDGGNAAP